jgi:hypothetical protein
MEVPAHSIGIVQQIQRSLLEVHPDMVLDGVYVRKPQPEEPYTFLPWYMFSRNQLQRIRDELHDESEALTVGFRPRRSPSLAQETSVIGLSMDTVEACSWFGVNHETGTPFRRNNPYLKRRNRPPLPKPIFAATHRSVAGI